jgi:integrase
VTATALRALPDPDEHRAGSWPGVLRAAVRDEFAVEIYRPVAGDPVLFGPTCAVGGCPATGVNRSLGLNATGVNRSVGTRFRGYLCLSHVRIWRRAGQPPIDGWVRDAALTARGLAMPAACKIPACRRSARSNGFCTAHMKHWTIAGRPEDLDAFAANTSAVVVRDQRCAVPACPFPSAGRTAFATATPSATSTRAYRRLGLTVAGYLALLDDARAICAPKFDMRDLPAVVQLELQYALQCRQQAARAAMGPLILGTVVRWLRHVGVQSALERSETFWIQNARERFRPSTRANPLAWLRYVRHSALALRDRDEGLEIWEFDTWPVDRLDIDGRYAHQPGRRIYFAEIDPPWLRELVKRWARWRITTATKSPASIACSTSSIRRFCRFADEHGVALSCPAAITRSLLERYLIAVRRLDRSPGRQASLITDLKVLLDDVRLHDWAPGLPANATYFTGEVPRSREHLPRFIDEFVMGQISDDATIARLPDLTTRTAVVILIETGLRSIDTLRLPFDPITVDEAGAPYLIFYNHKLSRDAVIPISQRLVAQIRRSSATCTIASARRGRPTCCPRSAPTPAANDR